MALPTNRIVIILGIVLALVVAASVLVLWAVPNGPTTTPVARESTTTTTASAAGFNVDVLQRQIYQLFNRQLIREGALPVLPPAVIGKANPFL